MNTKLKQFIEDKEKELKEKIKEAEGYSFGCWREYTSGYDLLQEIKTYL